METFTHKVKTSLGEVEIRTNSATPPSQDVVERWAQANKETLLGGSGVGSAPKVTNASATVAKKGPTLGGTLADAGLEAGGGMAGQVAGGFGGPFAPVTVPIGGGIGSVVGNIAAQKRRQKAGEQEGYKLGEIVGAFVTGLIPGGSLAKGGIKTVAKEAAKSAAGNIAGTTAQVGIDEGRLINPIETAIAIVAATGGTGLAKALDAGANKLAQKSALEFAQDESKKETLRLGKELGYVVPPSTVAPNVGNDMLNALAGKAATAQEAAIRNQRKTNAAIRKELGIPEDKTLGLDTATNSLKALNDAKAPHFSVYKQVADVSPDAETWLKMFREDMSKANKIRVQQTFAAVKDPIAAQEEKRLREAADSAWVELEKELSSKLGKRDGEKLIGNLKESRKKLAQIGIVEDVVNPATGDVDAQKLGQLMENSVPLSGEIEKVARFSLSFKNAVQEASKVPPAGVNQLLPLYGIGSAAAAGLGYLGYKNYGSEGAMAGMAIPAAFFAGPRGARDLILSKPYQDFFVNYVPQMTRQDAPAILGRFLPQAAGRQVESTTSGESLTQNEGKGIKQMRTADKSRYFESRLAQINDEEMKLQFIVDSVKKGTLDQDTAKLMESRMVAEKEREATKAAAEASQEEAAPEPVKTSYIDGQIYKDRNGIRKRYSNGSWLDPEALT